MVHSSQLWLLCSVTLLLASSLPNSQARVKNENGVRTAVFLSPKFELAPGSVVNKFFYNVDFPRGHIALKNFNAEVVDEAGNSIPLHETYLHHWVVFRYYQLKGVEVPKHNGNMGFHQSDFITVPNSGPCENNLGQYFGLGSETRKTATHVPEPYGIEVGNPAEIPPGYEERWLMNVHGIDTRGVEDRLGCTECRCELYNVTQDEYGRALRPGYKGGLKCCYDQTQCRMREGIESAKRGLYMRYTVTWVDWDASVVPVKIYIFDVTDIWKKLDGSTDAKHHCLVEYEVESCSATGVTNDGCIDTKRVSLSLPTGGNVIYGVAHQHTGGIGSTLYGEDGRVICSSIPTYGEGKEAGNEAGYIVGMSTCYPRPGSVQISDGETLVLVSNYSRSVQGHTGVMGLFYILVADDASPKPKPFLQAPIEVLMQGVADGRAVDLTALDGYASLIDELEKMFEIKGELRPRNRWEVVYMDDEGDMMLLGDDDPWPKIFICSSEEVKKMGPRYKLPASSLGGEGAIKHETMTLPVSLWGVALFGVAIVAAVVVAYRRRSEREDGYQSIVM